MPPITCDACRQPTADHDVVNYGSMEDGYRRLCGRCFNEAAASRLGLRGFEHVAFEPIRMLDGRGAEHEFRFRNWLCGTGLAIDAFELRDGSPAGYRFQVIGEPDDDPLELLGKAHGGTLFLDEIGDMDLNLQAKLLRVLQERTIKPVGSNQFKAIDVRVIAATHKDLKKSIANETFREDLYYRLSVIPIVIPPLRHRPEDIPLLALHFMHKYVAINGKKSLSFTQDALRKLMSFTWPGNVRELENMVERLVVLSRGPQVDASDIPDSEQSTSEQFFGQATSDSPTLEELEKRYIQLVLEKTGGKKEKAAQILGINRRTLYRKEKEYGLVMDSDEEPEVY